jgi:hypothetical protein
MIESSEYQMSRCQDTSSRRTNLTPSCTACLHAAQLWSMTALLATEKELPPQTGQGPAASLRREWRLATGLLDVPPSPPLEGQQRAEAAASGRAGRLALRGPWPAPWRARPAR